jgi:wyosine [tRNA(Phe)-imidazoG37] synthetase (radical SAM superfamily)
MSGFLFSDIVFGPVKSRRLGVSLGINLLPTHKKVCNFNCIYCECGWNEDLSNQKIILPTRIELKTELERKLIELKENKIAIDSITFAGNGEPSIHPDFSEIVDDIILMRNKYVPNAKTTLLSNAGLLNDEKVMQSILKLDNNILKLDCGTDRMFHLINRCSESIKISDVVENLKRFKGKLIIQTLFLRGKYLNELIDNTTEEEINLWMKYIEQINPEYVMIYPIERETPAQGLEKISKTELDIIAGKLKLIGIESKVYE